MKLRVSQDMNTDIVAESRIISFDYIRTTVILLVMVQHAVLAYTTFAFLNPWDPIATFSPVVDSQRWFGFDFIALFNDSYIMALLFFISGIFIWPSISRKGPRLFLRDRIIRLGIPFIVGVLFLVPLAYFPAQLEVELIFGGNTNFIDFWYGMIYSGFRTAGPLWFLGVLLAFNILFVILNRIASKIGGKIMKRIAFIFNNPLAFFGVLFGISTIAFLPMVLVFGIENWTLSNNKILLYLVYFLFGTVVGVYGLNNTIFNSKSTFAKFGGIGMVMSFISFIFVYLFLTTNNGLLYGITFSLTCATAVLGFIALFLHFVKKRLEMFVNLSQNSFGIYLIHYPMVYWIQFFLLEVQLPVILKASIVFIVALFLSWGIIAIIRQIPSVKRII